MSNAKKVTKAQLPQDPGLPDDALPDEFQAALLESGPRGSICAVSRVAQDCYGNVTHVEWGVTTPWLDDWAAGPTVAQAEEVARSIAMGAQIFTLFPTATGFACGPEVVVDGRGNLVLASCHPPEWNVSMLARLRLPQVLN